MAPQSSPQSRQLSDAELDALAAQVKGQKPETSGSATGAIHPPETAKAKPSTPPDIDYDLLARVAKGEEKLSFDEAVKRAAGKAKGIRAESKTEQVAGLLPAAGGTAGGVTAALLGPETGWTSLFLSTGLSTLFGAAGEVYRQGVLRAGKALATTAGPTIEKAVGAIPSQIPGAESLKGGVSQEMSALRSLHYTTDPRQMMTDVALSGLWQGALDLTGRIIGVPLKGGWFKPKATAVEDQSVRAADKAFGLNLPAEESGRSRALAQITRATQAISHRSVGGKIIADTARETGERNAIAALEKDLDSMSGLARPSAMSMGAQAKAGLTRAKGGLELAGKQVGETAEKTPPLDITPFQRDIRAFVDTRLRPLAEETSGASRLREAAQALQSQPLDVTPELDKLNVGAGSRGLIKPGHPIYQMAEKAAQEARDKQVQVMLKQADKLTERKLAQSAVYKKAQDLLRMRETVDFSVLKEARTALRRLGKDPDVLLGEGDKPVYTHFKSELSDLMEKASPDFAKASEVYGAGARLFRSKIVTEAMKQDPEQVVALLKRKAPTRVRVLREALLNWSGYVPPGASADVIKAAKARAMQGRLTWESIRTTWFYESLLKDNQGKLDPIGLIKRIRSTSPDVLREMFGSDVAGKRLLQHATDIGTAMARHPETEGGRIMLFMEVGRIAFATATGYSHGAVSGLEVLGALEFVPAMITWALYNPAAKQYLIEGFNAANTKMATAAFLKLGDAFMRTQVIPAATGKRSPSPGYPFAVSHDQASSASTPPPK